jgi:hypothetical protein
VYRFIDKFVSKTLVFKDFNKVKLKLSINNLYKKEGVFMKINKVFAIILVLTGVISQGYFWEDWGQPQTREQLDKRNVDLRYQEKQTRVQQKKADVAAEAQKRQQDLNYKQSQLEIQRKKDRLRAER